MKVSIRAVAVLSNIVLISTNTAPVTDIEPATSLIEETQDESAMPHSPLHTNALDDSPMDLAEDSISTNLRPTVIRRTGGAAQDNGANEPSVRGKSVRRHL